MYRTKALILLALIAALAVLVTSPGGAQPKVELIFSAGPTGGTWTPMAAATAEAIERKFPQVEVLVEPGAAQVNKGRCA